MNNDAMLAARDKLDSGKESRRSSSMMFGLSALVAGVIALGLAVLPGILLNQPHEPELPPPLADGDADPQVEVEAADDEGFVLKFKEFTFSLRKGDDDPAEENVVPEDEDQNHEQPIARPEAQPAIEAVDPWPSRLAFTSASFALVGLLLGPVAWARERHPALAGSAMAICSVALLWHYILAAIIVGVVIVVVLLFLSSLW